MVRTSLSQMAERAFELQVPMSKQFPAQYSVCSFFKEAGSLVQSALTKKQLEEFKKLPWGHLISVPEMQFSGQIIHSLLLRLVRDQPDDELWFCIQGKLLKFTYADFCRISGIKASREKPVFSTGEEVRGKVFEKYFAGSTDITFKTLKEKLKAFKPKRGDSTDPLKLVSLCYLVSVLLARDNKTKINLDYVKWADEFEKFTMYNWGLESYNIMVENLKTVMKGQPGRFKKSNVKNAKFTLYGCPHILQVWAYETVPNLGEKFAERVGNEDIPMLNWKADGFFHARKLNELVFKDNDDEEEAEEDVDEDDEEETENEDEEVGRKGFKAKVMKEIKALRKNVADLEMRLKLMEERVSAPCGVSNNAAEVGGNEVDANAMQMDDHDDPTHTEECGPTAVVDDANNVKESDLTTPSVEIISTILNELADVVDNSKDERECDPTTASNPIISPALLDSIGRWS
ncbi:unnamed protein product [Cuscuta europaea]|uniref:DUF1985 domain-containing protein n=1 Tax=Cuscuta europaea TaxID=41803 RepID=A0A9P1DZ79_CUSEU|nr:unnamed protein product [Cuscuta europaea]